MRSFLIVVAAVAVLGYAGLCWFLHAQQREMIYFGGFTAVDRAATDFALKRPDATLRGWVVNPDGHSPILYFGGNAERIELNREDFARMFPGRSVYLLAYRGYGASDGTPSEAALVGDALALFDYVQTRHPDEPVSAIGRSLGSGVASQLAARRPLAKLALITPFDSLAGAAKAHYPIFPIDWLLEDRYESAGALRAFERPLLILHGGRDEVVPEANTLRLVAALPGTPQVVRIAAADHNDISFYPDFAPALSAFINSSLQP
jgi:pimeloyl-ACP methyl ester carboxylesterase